MSADAHRLAPCSMRRHALRAPWLAVAGLAIAVTFVAPHALAEGGAPSQPAPTAKGPCGSPRAAVFTLLDRLQPATYEPAAAAACQDRSLLDDPTVDGPRLAERLKKVLDARGLYVNLGAIPSEPDHEDSLGEHRYALLKSDVSGLELVRQGARWVFSAETLARIDGLYAETFPAGLDSFVETLPPVFRRAAIGLLVWQWLGLALLFAGAWLLRRLLVWLFNALLARASRLQRVRWLTDVFERSDGPLGGLAFAFLLALGHPLLQLPVELAAALRVLERLIGAVSLVWLLFRAADVLSELLSHRAASSETRLDDQVVPIVRKALKIIVGVMGALFVLQNLGVDVTSLLATISIGGVAIAFAAKDTLANFFGSAMVFVDQPFQIGDFVTMGGGLSGTVEEVGFRSSRLRMVDGSVITVPNARMTDTAITNLGARPNRRYDTTLGLTYGTPAETVQAFCEGAVAVIEAHPKTLKGKNLVRFVGFGASSLDVMVRCWFDTQSYDEEMNSKHQLNMELLRLAEALGVSYAFPSTSVYVEQHPSHPASAAPAVDPQALAETTRAFGPGGDRTEVARWRVPSTVGPANAQG